MAQNGTKIRYPQFKGRSGTDPDVFLNEFKQIVVANREGTEPDYLLLFPALLKGRASRWYNGTTAALQADWAALQAAFLAEFRDLDFNARVFHKLNNLRRKKKESLRNYTQRFRDMTSLVNQTGVPQLIEWYVGGLDANMGLQCRVGPRTTIAEVIATAEAYEAAKRTEQSKERREPSKGRTADSGSSESEDSSGTDTDSSEEKIRKSRKKKYQPRKKRSNSEDTSSEESEGSYQRARKVKTRDRADIDTLTKELADLKVQIATPKDKRRDPKAVRHNLWCANCHSSGHTKDDCRLPKTGQSYYIDEVNSAASEDYYTEGVDGTVYHVSMGGNSNIARFAQVRYNPPEYVGGKVYPSHGPSRHPPNPAYTKVHGRVPPSEITCFRCQEKGHYTNACPNAAKSPGYTPLCQNCGESGHIAPHCAKPVQPRPKVNFVDLPSTSGAKNDVPVHLMTWEKPLTATTTTENNQQSLAREPKVVRFDPRVLKVTPIAASGSEGWPSDKKWTVNAVSTRSNHQRILRESFILQASDFSGHPKSVLQRANTIYYSSFVLSQLILLQF
ncbi:hypothetical protein R1sor_014001 [Riccia sorocarpa]|uniref:CCHC-type domain-containing protein n=1 Tax=Riccia sorocarpa TaxID=122646 RepID=A0ABD3H860_9MARC